MSAQTGADIIIHNFSIKPELQFNGASLVRALGKSHLRESMDIPWAQIPPDHCGIVRRMLQPKGKSKACYFYATTSGNGPSLEKAWTENISLGIEFTTKKNTRSNSLNTSIEQEEPYEPSTTKKRKRNDTVSTEAKKLFKPFDDEPDALEAIMNQMELLSEVLSDAKGYWSVMVGLEKDDDLTTYQKWTIQI